MTLHPSVTHPKSVKRFSTLLSDLNKIHNNFYSYDDSVYLGDKYKITIKCPLHGNFEQVVSTHVQGKGCKQCANEAQKQFKKDTLESFILKTQNVHHNKYSYHKTDYVNSTTKVTITCLEHGDFEQVPSSHLQGVGCPECGEIARAKKRSNTLEKVLLKSIEVHGLKYDYSNTKYTSVKDPMEIVCPAHGIFHQTPDNHMQGNGCPSCATTGFNTTTPAILYYVSINHGQCYKLGITNNSIKRRFGPDYKLITNSKEWFYSSGKEAYEQEQKILKEYSMYKYVGFNPLRSGHTELFSHDVLGLF